MKPIGYYTSHTPGDESLFDELVEAWGTHFQSLNNAERLWLIYRIGHHLWIEKEGEDVSEPVENGFNRIVSELSLADQLGLIESLVNQCKHYK